MVGWPYNLSSKLENFWECKRAFLIPWEHQDKVGPSQAKQMFSLFISVSEDGNTDGLHPFMPHSGHEMAILWFADCWWDLDCCRWWWYPILSSDRPPGKEPGKIPSISISNHIYPPATAASFHVKALLFFRIQLSCSPVLFTIAEVECFHSTLRTFHLPEHTSSRPFWNWQIAPTCLSHWHVASPSQEHRLLSCPKDVTLGDSILL